MPDNPQSHPRIDFDYSGESVDPPSNAPPESGGVRLGPSSPGEGSGVDVTPETQSTESVPSDQVASSSIARESTTGDAKKTPPAGTAEPGNKAAGSTVSDAPSGAAGKIEPAMTSTAQTPPPTPTPTAPEEANHDVHDYNVGDQPTPQDTLGFEPYVNAIASFLTNDSTHPPLTLSIEGKWGSGKSSFMWQLRNQLKDMRGGTVVEFNAWQYDKDEAMWAAFALKCVRQISDQLTFFHRWLAHVKLFVRRFSWERGWKDVAKLFLMLMVLGTILLLPLLARDRIREFVAPEPPAATSPPASGQSDGVLTSSIRKLIAAGGSLAYLGLIFGLFRKAKEVVGNPLTINLKQHLDTPDYKSRVAFIDHFHTDFNNIVKIYGRGKKVYVFIDDLDRCEVPKAADLMQAVNLMISDNEQLIFIMGLDREKVAAGLAVKYEKLLPYLAPAPAANTDHTTATFDPVLGLEYGYNFIEKFIQLPFLVPQASEPQVKGFLQQILAKSDSPPPTPPPVPGLQAAAAGESAEKTVTENTEMVTEILKMVAPTFEYNPRRLKQFINAFRLKTFIASRTGLFGQPADPARHNRLTTQQLGKFVAISLRWPLLLADLDVERDLLSRLQILALNKITRGQLVEVVGEREVLRAKIEIGNGGEVEVTEALWRWYQRYNLRKLLCVKPFTGNGAEPDPQLYSLEKLDVNKLLEVSPLIKPAPTTAKASVATAAAEQTAAS
jgi:hypothetical protein